MLEIVDMLPLNLLIPWQHNLPFNEKCSLTRESWPFTPAKTTRRPKRQKGGGVEGKGRRRGRGWGGGGGRGGAVEGEEGGAGKSFR